MAGRRPGVPPKNPEDRARTNTDPLLSPDGWMELSPEPNTGEIPALPEWLTVSEQAEAIYRHLGRLPQAATWGQGTWFELHMTLPLVERYLSRPGSENFKAIISTLGAALRLTEDDLQRARMRWQKQAGEDDGPAELPSEVADINERRKRLTG